MARSNKYLGGRIVIQAVPTSYSKQKVKGRYLITSPRHWVVYKDGARVDSFLRAGRAHDFAKQLAAQEAFIAGAKLKLQQEQYQKDVGRVTGIIWCVLSAAAAGVIITSWVGGWV